MTYTEKTELLYFSRGYSAGVAAHSHLYWQLEYCISGKLTGSDGGKEYPLLPGDFWLIAPGQKHKFFKNQESMEFLSLKFNTKFKLSSCVGNSAAGTFYLNEISKIVAGKTGFTAYSAEGKKIIEHLLSGVLSSLCRNSGQTSAFERRIQQLICQYGAALNINDLAENFQISRTEFKYLFKKETGSGQIKKYLDESLLDMAEQALEYSDMPIRKIADELHFSSIYAFSRYYKRYRGISPAAFRKTFQKFSP